MKGDIAVDFSVRPSVRPFLVKVFLLANISVSIHRIAFIFHIQLPKDIGNTFPGYFCKKIYFFIVNLGVLDLDFFYKIWVFCSKFFKVLLTCKCVAGLLLNFIKTFFITFATVSKPFSVKTVIFLIHNLLTFQLVGM